MSDNSPNTDRVSVKISPDAIPESRNILSRDKFITVIVHGKSIEIF